MSATATATNTPTITKKKSPTCPASPKTSPPAPTTNPPTKVSSSAYGSASRRFAKSSRGGQPLQGKRNEAFLSRLLLRAIRKRYRCETCPDTSAYRGYRSRANLRNEYRRRASVLRSYLWD